MATMNLRETMPTERTIEKSKPTAKTMSVREARETATAICAGTGSVKHKVDLLVAAAKGRLPSGAIRSETLLENVHDGKSFVKAVFTPALPDAITRLARPRSRVNPLDVHDSKTLVESLTGKLTRTRPRADEVHDGKSLVRAIFD